MKKLILLVSLLGIANVNAQETAMVKAKATNPKSSEKKVDRYAAPTSKKDTLFLLKGEEMAKLIRESWDHQANKNLIKPTFIWVNQIPKRIIEINPKNTN